jgi:uncharacterized protein (TIGR02444 family)
MLSRHELEGNALWKFSVAFYAAPGVANALIALQDRDGLDVNLILFALWLGLSGHGRLDRAAVAAAGRAVSNIRNETVKPLRALRRKLKNNPDPDIQRLREGVRALELAAEKVVQSRLVCLARPGDGSAPRDARLADAFANFALYLGPTRVQVGEARLIREALEGFPGEH